VRFTAATSIAHPDDTYDDPDMVNTGAAPAHVAPATRRRNTQYDNGSVVQYDTKGNNPRDRTSTDSGTYAQFGVLASSRNAASASAGASAAAPKRVENKGYYDVARVNEAPSKVFRPPSTGYYDVAAEDNRQVSLCRGRVAERLPRRMLWGR
jgi:hypothetical protein